MKKFRRLLLILAVALCFLVPMNNATAQGVDLDLEPQAEFMVWPTVERNYQHEYRAGVEGDISWRFVEVDGYVNGVFWQTNTSKVPGSPFNAENNMNNMVKYGATLKAKKDGFFVGPTIHRTEIHVVWRFKNNNGYLDGWGGPAETWRGEERACRSGVGCPSIAYQDAWGAAVGYEDENVDLEARWLFYRWKALTLIPRPIRLEAELTSWDGWRIEADAWRDLKHRWRGDVAVQKRIYEKLWGGMRVGRLQPDHKVAFTRFGVGLVVR